MNGNDPILNAIKIRFERLVLFFVMSALISLVLWVWVLLGWFDLGFASAWKLTKEAYLTSEEGKSIVLIFRGCGIIGLLSTLVTFLLAAFWWRKSGDIHRRGAQFIDARDGRS